MQTVPAEIDENGNIRLLKKLDGGSKRRALVTVLDGLDLNSEAALLSEAALAEDWNRPEEDKAWSYLQSER